MITETHQCPVCSALLSADQVDNRQCTACGASFLSKIINTMPAKPAFRGNELQNHAIKTDFGAGFMRFGRGYGHFY